MQETRHQLVKLSHLSCHFCHLEDKVLHSQHLSPLEKDKRGIFKQLSEVFQSMTQEEDRVKKSLTGRFPVMFLMICTTSPFI